MPLNELQKTFLCGESLASEDLNSIVLAINNTVTAVNTIKNNLEGHQYDVSVPITSIYCRTKKNINASGFFPQSDVLKVALFEEVTNCQLTQGIKYNVNFLTVTLDNIADNMNGVWTAYPQGITEELPHEWEASFKKLEDSNEVIFMFGPVLVSNYGFSGADGDGVQYVYKLFDHELTEIERTANTPVKPTSPNLNGEYIPSGWFDDPLGTTSEYPYEYVAALKRINGSWGDFEKIALWGTYSEDGINGDFQTRVFCRFNPTALKLAPNKPLGGTYDSPQPGSNDSIAWSMTVPSGDGLVWTSIRTFKGDGTVTDWSVPVIESDSNELDIEYSSSATKPSIDTLRGTPGVPHPSNNVWHDPSESGIDLSSMIWRAERKIKNKVYEGNWVITRLTGVKGSFKSVVFKRFTPTILLSSPATPSGGTYDNPVPSGWSDGIPGGNEPIWASTCTFTEEDTEPVSSLRWSEPKLQSDTEELDIEFSPNTTQPSNPTGEPFSNRQSLGWYDSSASNFNSVGPMIWRAERKVVNGQYEGSWTVTRIFGELGIQGVRGGFKSFVFKRSNDVISSIAVADDNATYDNPIPNNTWSDSVPEGTATLWMAVSKFTGVGDTHTSWTVSQQSDSRDFDIEFSTQSTKPSAPQGDPFRDRRSDNPVWYNSNTIPSGETAIWRAERKVYEGKFRLDDPWVITRIQGEKGDDAVLNSEQVLILAKAGLEIIINPQNIILDLSEVLTSASDDKIDNDFTVNISVYKNGTILNTNDSNDYLINSNSVLMYGSGSNEAFANTSNAFFEVQSKAIVIKNLPITTNNNQYTYTYNKGHIKGTIAVILEGTTYNVPFNIPWYLNKLGERETKIRGDVASTYMSRTAFSNPNDPVISAYTASILDGADGRMATYGLLKSKTGGGYEASFDAQYLQNAAENVSKLSKSITGTNLLSDNWTTFSSPVEITAGSGVTMERRVTKVSPQIPLSEGIYILSWYSTETSPNNFKVSIGTSASKISGNIPYITNNDITWLYYGIGNSSGNLSGGRLSSNQETEYEGDYYTRTENSSEVTYVRFYCRIIVNTELYYSFVISTSTGVNSTYPVIRPQLELCLATNTEQFPTPWVPGPQDFSSEIKLTAEAITSTVLGLSNNISQVLLTAESIQSQVTGLKEKKNLFSGALTGTDWKGALYVVQEERYRFIDITVEDYWFIKESLASYVASPVVAIESGKKYTLSFDAEGTSAINVYILVSNVLMLTLTTSATSRRTVTFTASSTGNVRFMFDIEKIRYPQLEKGEEATIFEAGDEEISSTIKQTADSISLNVTSALNTADNINSNLVETGINITGSNRGIEMTADNFALKDTNNNLVFGKDPNTNNMTFTGEVKASSFVAGDLNNLTIETSGNTIKFNDNGVTKAYFIAEGSGLLLYIKDNTGTWKKIDFTKWASGVAGDTTDTDIVFYTLRNGGNSNGAEINSSIEVPYNTSLNKYYEDRAGTTKKTLGNSTQYYKKLKISNVVIYENGSYYIYNGSTEDRSVYKYTPITITDGVLSESGTPYFVANGNYLTRESWITAATTNIFYKDSSVSIKDSGGNMNYTDSSFSLDKVSKTTTMTSISAYSTITSQSVGSNNAGFRYVVSTVPVSS